LGLKLHLTNEIRRFLEVVRQAFLAGARGYVVKSDIAQELLTALRDAIQKKHYLNRRLKEQVKRMGAAAGLGLSF